MRYCIMNAKREDAILHIGEIWCTMALWKCFDYVTDGGVNLMQNWYQAQESGVRAEFDAVLMQLKGIQNWESKKAEDSFKPLTGKHKGLGEVKFSVEVTKGGHKRPFKRRFRPVGIWPPRREFEFELILGCEKCRMTYKPHNAFDKALEIKKKIDAGKGSFYERH